MQDVLAHALAKTVDEGNLLHLTEAHAHRLTCKLLYDRAHRKRHPLNVRQAPHNEDQVRLLTTEARHR